jgi:hypothetical protein
VDELMYGNPNLTDDLGLLYDENEDAINVVSITADRMICIVAIYK